MAAPILTDEQVALIRQMREWHGGSIAAISGETGVSSHVVKNICGYLTRASVEIAPNSGGKTLDDTMARWRELQSISERK